MKYLNNSKDPIEKLYGEKVTKQFTNYEEFWYEFVGDPKASKVQPYEYVCDSGLQRRIEQIRMAHYSLFCHLAGAHYSLEELSRVHEINNSNEKYFKHWEHFDTGYMHLGSVFYLFYCLWNLILKTKLQRNGKGYDGKVVNFLCSKNKKNLIDNLHKLEKK